MLLHELVFVMLVRKQDMRPPIHITEQPAMTCGLLMGAGVELAVMKWKALSGITGPLSHFLLWHTAKNRIGDTYALHGALLKHTDLQKQPLLRSFQSVSAGHGH